MLTKIGRAFCCVMKRNGLAFGCVAAGYRNWVQSLCGQYRNRKPGAVLPTNMGMPVPAAVAQLALIKSSPPKYDAERSRCSQCISARMHGLAPLEGRTVSPISRCSMAPSVRTGTGSRGQPFPLRDPRIPCWRASIVAYGFTNLIENEAGTQGSSDRERPFRQRQIKPPTAAGSAGC